MTRRPGKKRPKGGVLAVISLLMIGSAAIRVGLEAGPALAKSAEPTVPLAMKAQAELPGAQVLLTELRRREEALKRREAAALDREKALEIADKAIETRLVALVEAEEALRATLALAEKAAETDLTRLTDVYQSMKPKDAAALFETMDPTFAAGFLSRMPPDAAAGVLAGLSPEGAYTISVIMAGRNASAPQE
ncbi:MotE family protein [Ruegeria meonggei]|uniref:MotE family protein n=1 Tax=Ruegeria meonggei TaxID=1446476 RepID=UPI0036723C60